MLLTTLDGIVIELIVIIQSIQSLDSIELEDHTLDDGKAGPLGRLSQPSFTKQQDPRMIQVMLQLFIMHRCQPSRNRAGNPAFCLLSRIPAFFCENVLHFWLYFNKIRFAEDRDNCPRPEDSLCTENHTAC